jgi:hypothetical protein
MTVVVGWSAVTSTSTSADIQPGRFDGTQLVDPLCLAFRECLEHCPVCTCAVAVSDDPRHLIEGTPLCRQFDGMCICMAVERASLHGWPERRAAEDGALAPPAGRVPAEPALLTQ